jgi:hypothetical protein
VTAAPPASGYHNNSTADEEPSKARKFEREIFEERYYSRQVTSNEASIEKTEKR